MNTRKIERSQAEKGNLILVNPSHPLRQRNFNLVSLKSLGSTEKMDFVAAQMLQRAIWECKIQSVVAVSGWRSQKQQEQLYMDSLRDNGAAYTQNFVALPGCSEHECGLAIDLAEKKDVIDPICPFLPTDGAFAKLRKKLVQCGFIERYRQEKQAITKIAAEPWHFRFVGFPHSILIEQRGWALEEYVEWLHSTSMERPFEIQLDQMRFSIWRMEADQKELTLTLPDRQLYQLSGDNCGGVIVTTWRS